MEGDTITALKDIIQFEERLHHNHQNLKRVRHQILLRWRILSALCILCWLLSKYSQLLFFSCLFYAFISLFVVLVGVTLKSGRWLSAEQFREDAVKALMPFNLRFEEDEGRVVLEGRVPGDLNRLLAAYRAEYHKRK